MCSLRTLFRSWLTCLICAGVVAAQFGDGRESARGGADELRSKVSRWRVGVRLEAIGGPCRGLFATVPVPSDWPEQVVKIVDEQISAEVSRVKYRTLDGGVEQMLISVPRLAAGKNIEAVVTFEVERHWIDEPDNPSSLTIPRKPPREVAKYLGASPYIEVRHRKIRDLEKELTDPSLSDWEQIEKFYDYVRENVEYRNGALKGALAALDDGYGDCEELTSLFIALCRAHGVPARTVWVPGHCYPEFYFEDAAGNGLWIPCQAAGTRAFGSMPELRPILQKGDNFKVPEKKQRQRYVAEFLTGKSVRGGGKPRVTFVRDEMAAE